MPEQVTAETKLTVLRKLAEGQMAFTVHNYELLALVECAEALGKLLEAESTQSPPYEAGKETQDAWADRRAAARSNARAALQKVTEVTA